MKLDRNINTDGRGKYALLKLRKLNDFIDGPFGKLDQPIADALKLLEGAGILDWGNTIDSEFMVIRLKDKYAESALFAYAKDAQNDGESEYAAEIGDMALRSGRHHPNCKRPD